MATTYCTELDITNSYGTVFWLNVADDDGGGTADGVAQAIAWASGTIDGLIGRKYNLPLLEIPVRLRETAVDLSIFRRATTADRKTDIIQGIHDDAIKYLKALASGEVSLGLDDPPASHIDGITQFSNTRQITKLKWEDQM